MGRRIQWRPDFMRKRYENWVENLNVDWCVSRQRYFGVPIPVWYPLDADGQPVFSNPIYAQEQALPVDPMTQAPVGFDESRRGKPGGFTGEADVFDTWFTSSLTPQVVARWGDPDDQMDRLFPMDVRPQAHDIIRTWAFYTIVKAMLHHGDAPWRNIALSGWILDPDRKKMSKSRGNVVTPKHLLDQWGADSVRYWAASARLGVDTAFDEQFFKVGKRLVTKIFNAAKFVLQQSADPSPQPSPSRGERVNVILSEAKNPVSAMNNSGAVIVNELDRAFTADLREVVRRATEAFEEYDFAQALEVTESFFWSGFTDNYIELVKARARSETDAAGRASAVATLRLGLSTFLRLFAPFTPSICDEVWSWAFAAETGIPSVHVAPWPAGATPAVSVHVIPSAARNLSSSPLPAKERVGAWVELPSSHNLTGVLPPTNSASFKAACEAIAAVRKAKTEAGLSLGAPMSLLTLSAQEDALSELRPVLPDVCAASGVEQAGLVPGASTAAARYIATIVAAGSAR
jgi:valyl-tRNA synthetase